MPDTTKTEPKHSLADGLKEKADHLGNAVKEGLDSAADRVKQGLHHDTSAPKKS